MTALGPGNDTRVNLLLLLFDRGAPPPEFLPPRTPPAKPLEPDAVPILLWKDFRERFFEPEAEVKADRAGGEGSRCRSIKAGAAAFATAIIAAPDIAPDERTALVGARKALAPPCTDAGVKAQEGQEATAAPAPPVHSPTGRAFATYLQGTEAFYQSRLEPALAAFTRLHGNPNAWLANAADYMVARTEVNLLQVDAFDQYGELAGSEHVDQKAATHAAASLEAYLRDHPNGIYAASARGLRRRVFWLAGRTEALTATYAALLAQPPADRDIDDATLVEEIDNKLLPRLTPETIHDPLLLATLDLKAMREPRRNPDADHPTAKRPEARRVDLEAQRATFAATPLLFEFIVATQAFYLDHDLGKVLELLPDDTRRRGGDHLWFSRQILRGLALEAKHDRNAQGFWKELYPGATRPLDRLTVELALALHDERAGTLDDVFAHGSIVTSPEFRKLLLQHDADANLLRREAQDLDVPESERETALFTLLAKDLTHARYADFVADVAQVPADASIDKNPSLLGSFTRREPGELNCPLLSTTATQLARDPRAVRARLCLAEFLRVSGVDQAGLNGNPSADDLGDAPSMFLGRSFVRTATYNAIIADKTAPAADRAFALYRAVKCYEPSSVNGCDGPDVPKSRRKAWYTALKRDYPDTRWAKELAYWW